MNHNSGDEEDYGVNHEVNTPKISHNFLDDDVLGPNKLSD